MAAPLAMPPLRTQAAVPTAPTWALSDGVAMPTLALNTAGLTADDSERALTAAVARGITHVDFHPGIERDGVARVLRSSGASNLFLTTKIRKPSEGDSPAAAAEAASKQIADDLAVLGVDGVDMLLLRDHPSCEVMRAQWAVLEAARASGKAKALGTVNYCKGSLSCLLESAKVKPAVNYYMLHVGMGADAHGLRSFGEAEGVRTFAYGALGEPGPSDELLASPVLRRIGRSHGRSTEQVALRWLLQSGVAVSVRPTADFGLGTSQCADGSATGRCGTSLDMRASSFDWSLTAQEMAELDAMPSPDGNPTLFSSQGCPGPSPLRP